MSVVIENFETGYCWDFKAYITNADFIAGNLTGSKFFIYHGTSLLKTITAGGSGYTFDAALTKVTLDIHVEKTITALLTKNTRDDLFINWQYGSTLEHSKKIILKKNAEIK